MSFDLSSRTISPTEYLQSHSVILNNALFLLQMINNPPEIQSSSARRFSSCSIKNVPKEKTFVCSQSLGITDTQVDEDEDAIQYENMDSPFHVVKRRKPTVSDSVADNFDTEESLALPQTGPRRRKASNGDQTLGSIIILFRLDRRPKKAMILIYDAMICIIVEKVETGFHLLSHPSSTLQKIVSANNDVLEIEALSRLCGSVVSFVTEKHDLDSLKLSLFQAIRRISCRSYGMQVRYNFS